MNAAAHVQAHPTAYGANVVVSSRDQGVCRIGAYCSFGPGSVILLGGEHNIDWVSTYPFPEIESWDAERISGHPKPMGDVTIGSDVWVGREALILAGATIGSGSVIAARSVIRGVVLPYSIMVGNPARRVGGRFTPEIVERLLKIAWWGWPPERIRLAMPLFMSPNVEEFCEAAEKGRI